MKLKLISAGIIALLVLTVVPMAVAAQPAPTPVSRTILVQPVYLLSFTPPDTVRPVTGIIIFNTISGVYACSGILHLAPNTVYWLGVYARSSHEVSWVRWAKVKTDAHGQFFVKGRLDKDLLTSANEAIQTGGVFTVYRLSG